MNTGSGWNGSIDTAEVIVNLKDFAKDLVLKTTPENYKIKDNQISWKFTNLEPTTNDDIKIYYEPFKGYIEKIRTQKPPQPTQPTYVLNDKIVQNLDMNSLNSKEIINIKVLKDVKETEKYTSGKLGVVLIYTKAYAVEKLKKLITSKSTNNHSSANDSSSDLVKNTELVISDTSYKEDELLKKIVELKEDELKNIKIKDSPEGKTYLQLTKE